MHLNAPRTFGGSPAPVLRGAFSRSHAVRTHVRDNVGHAPFDDINVVLIARAGMQL